MARKGRGPPFEPGTKLMICSTRVFLLGIHGVLLRPPTTFGTFQARLAFCEVWPCAHDCMLAIGSNR
jgi:hypothetical protein